MTRPEVFEKFDEQGPTGEEYVRAPRGWMHADEFFGEGGPVFSRDEIIDEEAGESLVLSQGPR